MHALPDIALFHDAKGRVKDAPVLPGPVADTHAHLDMLDDPALALARCAVHGVDFVLTVTDPTENPGKTYQELETWQQGAAALLEEWGCDLAVPRCRISIGCHPHAAAAYGDDVEVCIRSFAQDPRTAVIGEIGLDYHYDFSPREDQRRAFRTQIALAKELELPIMLHIREAHDEAVRILQEEGMPEQGALLHCFSLDTATLQPFLDLGCLVAYGGALTFNNGQDARESAARAPQDRLLTETDAPYMAPVPLRGTPCSPDQVVFTAARLLEVRGLVSERSQKVFLEAIHANALAFLDRPRSGSGEPGGESACGEPGSGPAHGDGCR